MRQGALATVEQSAGEVVEGALAVSAAVAFAPWPVVISAPVTNVVALTPGTLERTIFPAKTMDIRVAGVGMKELVEMREDWHG
jgi:hypothetical protein